MLIESLSFSTTKRSWSTPIPSRMDSPKTLVVVFGTPEFQEHTQAIQELTSALPRSHIIGCSSPSLMAGRDVSLHVVIAQFTHTTLTSTMSLLSDGASAGQAISRQLAKPNLRAVLTFADSTVIDGNALTRGFSSLDASVPVYGALSGGSSKVWILAGGLSKPGMTVAIGFYGDHVLLRSASRTGWEKLGPERTVTKADGPVVFELDGKPALSVYDEALVMLGKTRTSLPSTLAVPFAIRATARHDRSLIRSIVSVDEKLSALRFSVDIPQGYLAQPLQAKPEALLASCADAVTSVSVDEPMVGKNALAIAISHVGRRIWVDGSGLREEVAVVADSLRKPSDESGATTLIGMYGFGELTSLVNEHAQLNNQSFALGLIMESETPLARRAAPALAGAGGAIRAQAPTTKAGPAAHLRSKTPTVDDLFSEIELDGGAAAAPVAPPAPPSRPSSQTQPLIAPPRKPPPPPVPPPPVSSSRRTSGHHETSRPPPGTTAALAAASALGATAPPPRRRGIETSSTSAITPTRLRYQGGAWTTPPEGIDGPRTLAVVFGPLTATNAVQDLQRLLPNSHIIGCATDRALGAGVIEISAQLTTFERTDVQVASADLSKGGAIAAAAITAELDRPNLRCVIVLSDHSSAGSEVISSLRQSFAADVAIAGGISSVKNAWVVADSQPPRPGLVVAAGLYGDFVSVGHSHVAGEFEPLGPERPITRAADRIIFEVDGRPALPFLMEQIGAAKPDDVLRLPILLSLDGRKLGVGVIAGADPTAKSITMSLPVMPGTMLRLARVDHERLLDEVAQGTGLAKAANVTTEGPVLVFMASSMLRQRVLLDRVEEQVDAAADVLPKQVIAHTIGFSSHAEVGRLGSEGGSTALQSGTFSMLIVSESRTSLTAHVDPAETPSPVAVAARRGPGGVPTNPSTANGDAMHVKSTPSKPPKTVILRAPLEVSGTTAGAKITKTRDGDVTVVSFSGRLTESFKGESLGRELSGTVMFDLSKVERVTSFGVREWLSMLTAMQDRVKKLFYSHCSEAIVNQLSMIRKFAGRAQVISAFGPFLCDSCGEQFERLFDIEADAESIQSHVIADVMCPQCGARAHFDDDPETYFTFAPSHLGQPIPPAIRAVHDNIEAAGPVRTTDSIDKAMEGNVTRIRVNGRAATVRWQRVFDGSEGTLILDLGGVVVDEPGIASLEGALLQVPSEVESLRLERAPQALVDTFAVSGVPRKVTIASTNMVGFCASCNNRRPALLLVDDHLVAISAGRAPSLNCRRCNGPLDLVDAQTTLTVLAKHRRRASTAPTARISSTPAPPIVSTAGFSSASFGGAAALAVDPVTPAPLPIISQPPLQPAPEVMMASERPPARGSGGLILASAALVSIALAGSATAIIISRRTPATAEAPPVATAAPPPSVATAAAPSSPNVVTADLPPGWSDRTFAIDGETVFVVGRAEKGASPETALEIARTDATLQLLKQLNVDLAGTPPHDLVAARIRPAEYTQHAAKATERFFRQTAGIPGPERGETVIRRKDGMVEAYARYHLARASYNALVARYKKTVTFHGATIGRAFPLVSPELTDVDAVVVSVQTPRMFDGAPPRPGDLIKAAAGRPFPISDTLAADDWLGVNPSESLVFELDRDGSPATAKIRRGGAPVAVAFGGGPPRTAPPPPSPTPAAPPPPPPATNPAGPAPPATSYREGFASKEVSAKSTTPAAGANDLPALNYRDAPATPTTPTKPKK